jgi:Cof subfamily protein (haloacid dehalogenase superfamily)
VLRLIALDVDGTLLNSCHELPPAERDMLRAAQARGLTIVLATGKLMASLGDLVATLDLAGPAIACNGGAIHRAPDGALLRASAMTAAQRDLALDLLARHAPDLAIAWYTPFAVFSDTPPGPLDNILAAHHEPPLKHVARLDNAVSPPVKLLVTASLERIEALRAAIAPEIDGQVRLVRTGPYFLELMPPDVSKGAALREIQAMLGIAPAETVAIGDAENDIPLFEAAAVGIAMGNGSPEIKARASWITASNDEDGVAVALARLLDRDDLAI